MSARTVTPRSLLLLGCALLCPAAAARGDAAPAAGAAPGGAGAPIILTVPPATPDPAATYLFYLHGRIVQEQGRQASSPDHGPYLYDEILARLATGGVTVISEARPAGTEAGDYADRVASQVRGLVAAGVAPARIAVVGASMGGWMTLLVSHRLDLAGVGYVVMGICGDETDGGFAGGLHGDVLSIYEAGDPLGQSCAGLFGRSASLGRHAEIRLDTGLGHGFLYRPLPVWVDPAIAWARTRATGGTAPGVTAAGGAGRVLRVTPADSLTAVSQRIAADPALSEIILAAGTYRGGLTLPPPADSAATPAPLLVRPEAGGRVIFEGAVPVPKCRRMRRVDGVWWFPIEPSAGEPPALFDPVARVRYAYAADAAAVARFPGTCVVEAGRMLFHPPGGAAPAKGSLMRSVADYGLLIRRPGVTVRGLEFRNHLARGKWSSAVQSYADDTTVEDCVSENASIGFRLMGARAAILGATVRDVGCGLYLSGAEARVEDNRLFKRRDGFVVPTYSQDDSGIQLYYPARGGQVAGNLSVGFGTGLLIKAERAPYRVERNTLVGAGAGIGFLATDWHPGETFRDNVVAGFAQPIDLPRAANPRAVGGNCYAPWQAAASTTTEPGTIVGAPRFVDPAAGDYRLGPDDFCRGAATAPGAIGASPAGSTPRTAAAALADGAAAPPAAGPAAAATSPATPLPPTRAAPADAQNPRRPPRTWHVGVEGRDDAAGTGEAPLRAIQEAVDRAAPGDTILVHPGLYADPVRFTRGGTAGQPITLAAATPGTVVIDGQRRHDVLIDLDQAPFVVVRGFEIRWFRISGIRVRASEQVTVSECRIWNAPWGGTWPSGNGIEVERSPRFRAERNVLFAQERGIHLFYSPHATITHNTGAGNLYGVVWFTYSIEGTTCRDNSFAFQGNDAMAIFESSAGKELLAGFDSDHNNFGMTLQEQPPGTVFDRIVPRPIDRHLIDSSKALIYYEESPGTARRFASLAAWREFSGKDAHSIVADPLFIDSAARDFRPGPGSPNRGAGTDGGVIGAGE